MNRDTVTGTDVANELSEVDLPTVWGRLNTLLESFLQQLPAILIGIIIFILFIIVAAITNRVIRKVIKIRRKENLGIVLGRLSQWLIIFLGLLVTMAVIMPSVTAGRIVSVLGIGGVAIGFAFKDILQNFLAGTLILIREPFKLGDQIVYKNFEGTVTNVETRATYIRTYAGKEVIIPNGEIYTNPITVNTANECIRTDYVVGIGYGDNIDNAIKVIKRAMLNSEGVLESPPPDVLVSQLEDSYIGLQARWWASSVRSDLNKTSSLVLKNIKLELDKAGIDMPFPTQMVLFHDQTEEIDGDRAKQREGWPAGMSPPEPKNKKLES